MAKARAIVKRRKAVQNIRKITRTMQLIATARFQAAFNRATASKPYTEGVTRLVRELSEVSGDLDHALLKENSESKRSPHLVITSNRGLCGGYNAQLCRAALEQTKVLEASGQSVDLHVMGKKGMSFFRFQRKPMARTETRFEDKPQFSEVEPIAAELIDAYTEKKIDAVYVTYMKFISAGNSASVWAIAGAFGAVGAIVSNFAIGRVSSMLGTERMFLVLGILHLAALCILLFFVKTDRKADLSSQAA
jgi:F-type H+-transporting ATPase subunit gamma